MEKIIQKAIEGEYDLIKGLGLTGQEIYIINGEKKEIENRDQNDYINIALTDLQKIVCDPLFWQALGKVCGWKETRIVRSIGATKGMILHEWTIKALDFYEINLTEGWEKAVQYLQEIIK